MDLHLQMLLLMVGFKNKERKNNMTSATVNKNRGYNVNCWNDRMEAMKSMQSACPDQIYCTAVYI